MAGAKTDKETLNRTLEKVCGILHENNINDWFIMYGTLLGIVRENSCIQGDDDLDIMINCDYQHLRNAFEKKGFNFMVGHYGIKNPDTILKSYPTQEFASIDFYMFEKHESGDVYSRWSNVIATNCYPFVQKEWKSQTLNLPNEYSKKLINMYGKNWQIPGHASAPMNAKF